MAVRTKDRGKVVADIVRNVRTSGKKMKNEKKGCSRFSKECKEL